jgi:hypothetical protein
MMHFNRSPIAAFLFAVALFFGAGADGLLANSADKSLGRDAPLVGEGVNALEAELLTIAAVISPAQTDGSSWDIGEGADLVLCGVKGCYVSRGLEQPATFYAESLGPRVLDKAGACRDVLKCVFRGVSLAKLVSEDDTKLYLLDVDYVSHTALEKFEIKNSMACTVEAELINCEGGVHRPAFSLWSMQERVAAKAGKAGLDNVLYKGLLNARFKALTAEIGLIRAAVQKDTAAFYKLLFNLEVPKSCLAKPDFLSEVFFVTGLADARQRRAEAILKDLLGHVELERLEGIVQNSPAVFWAFRDIARQLGEFARAEQAVYEKDLEALYIKKNEKNGQSRSAALLYGWQVEGRAKAGLSICGIKVSQRVD